MNVNKGILCEQGEGTYESTTILDRKIARFHLKNSTDSCMISMYSHGCYPKAWGLLPTSILYFMFHACGCTCAFPTDSPSFAVISGGRKGAMMEMNKLNRVSQPPMMNFTDQDRL